VNSLLLAAIFLTRLPLRVREPPPLARAAPWFPVIGAAIGLAVGGSYWLAHRILPVWPAAFLALAGGILLTGALHEDGLADCADGFGGGNGPEHKLEIMRDSAIGSYGALALILSAALRASAIAGLEGSVAALIAAHALSRAALPAAMHLLPPASGSGVAAAAGRPSAGEAGAAILIALLLAALLLPHRAAAAAILATGVAAAGFARLARRQLGGHSGDVLGAMQQLGEVSALLAMLAAS
jgi:adenosylcobinamide-GDP ribazoletransferase